MIKFRILWVVLCLSLGMIALAPASDLSNDTTVPFYTIPYIKENRLKPGIFETEGYVTFIHQIKGCSTPGSVCPPGSDTSLIIVNEQKNGPENTAIRIKITKDTKGLQKGQQYRFTIEAGSGKLAPQSKLQSLKLLKFQLLQQKAT